MVVMMQVQVHRLPLAVTLPQNPPCITFMTSWNLTAFINTVQPLPAPKTAASRTQRLFIWDLLERRVRKEVF